MVEILDPQEDETVLDPTCGTGGFLRETLKHLLDRWREEEQAPMASRIPTRNGSATGTGSRTTREAPDRCGLRPLPRPCDQHGDHDPGETTGNIFHMDSLGFPRGHLSGVEQAGRTIRLGKPFTSS